MDMARGASYHASEAIRYDSIGAAGMATYHYRESMYALRMFLMAHPNSRLRMIYEARCCSYQNRIDVLEMRMARGRIPV